VVIGIAIIGLIGFGIELVMRMAERWLIPWKGKD
jgi:taurine transport system permease protein